MQPILTNSFKLIFIESIFSWKLDYLIQTPPFKSPNKPKNGTKIQLETKKPKNYINFNQFIQTNLIEVNFCSKFQTNGTKTATFI